MTIVQWILANKADILSVVSYIIAIATVFIKLFPTLPASSKLLGLIKFVAKYLALNTTVTDADRPK